MVVAIKRDHVRKARKVCEHSCFSGALADVGASVLHSEIWWISLFAKLALLAGAAAVYLQHYEEHFTH